MTDHDIEEVADRQPEWRDSGDVDRHRQPPPWWPNPEDRQTPDERDHDHD